MEINAEEFTDTDIICRVDVDGYILIENMEGVRNFEEILSVLHGILK